MQETKVLEDNETLNVQKRKTRSAVKRDLPVAKRLREKKKDQPTVQSKIV